MAGLYVHIPFCRSKCAYCDFYSGPLRTFRPAEYASALLTEHRARATTGDYATVYVGGGTPSAVDASLLAPFTAMSADGAEVTIEVNPEDVNERNVRMWRSAGFNRVSMGVQSLCDRELQAVGRRHSAQEAVEGYMRLRDGGFDNVSLDLIYGLPMQGLGSWQDSLGEVLEMSPEHLSAYCLQYEPGTLLHTRLVKGRIEETPEETIVEMYRHLCAETAAQGFEHYEISNFAKPGMHSRHNSAYWVMEPYLGLGPGAHSYIDGIRSYNPSDLPKYMENPQGACVIEEEDETERHNDRVMVELRTARGLNPDILSEGEKRLAKRLLVKNEDGRWRISEDDWMRADAITAALFREP